MVKQKPLDWVKNFSQNTYTKPLRSDTFAWKWRISGITPRGVIYDDSCLNGWRRQHGPDIQKGRCHHRWCPIDHQCPFNDLSNYRQRYHLLPNQRTPELPGHGQAHLYPSSLLNHKKPCVTGFAIAIASVTDCNKNSKNLQTRCSTVP